MSSEPAGFRSGFVALVGRPNVGKSTFLNTVLQTKLSAVTPRPQTTRNRILGVHETPGAQIVFIDTPGVHKPRSGLNRSMVDVAFGSLGGADAVLLLVEAAELPKDTRPSPGHANTALIDRIRLLELPCVLGLNKVDLIPKEQLLLYIDVYRQLYDFQAIVPLVATDGDGVPQILAALEPHLPEGPRLFPEDQLSDRAQRFFVAEMIREQIFLLYEDEVPYGSAVLIESYQEPRRGRRKTEIDALVLVERDNHKAILIGKGGQAIRELGIRSRAAIEAFLEEPVILRLHVKVRQGWSDDPAALRELGYEG